MLAVLLLLRVPVCLADQVLIANLGVQSDGLSVNNSRLIFSMQIASWPTGESVRVFVLPDDHPTHRSFTKDLLGLFPRQLRRVWDRQLYTGTGQAPEQVESEEAMRHAVANTPGAIGYLPREMIDETVRELQIQP
ncbi:MAG: hypothetical protein KDJ27_11080 [Gammaproteobacteria bacterium]|nr:hypothetical protein [Gammaproteobacteria bacterium]MCB1924266.1 hypothetical protein [Gammaproteobacteria bacterium]